VNKQYDLEEKKEIIAECQKWVAMGKSVTSFAQLKGIPKGTVYSWLHKAKTGKGSPKTSMVHIPKIREVSNAHSHIPLLVEMRCGPVSFVFNEGYSQDSIEATLLSLKKCGLL
jgi:transposase-like protein